MTANGIADPANIDGKIREVQKEYPRLQKFREQVDARLRTDVHIHTDGALYFDNRICVP